MDVMKRIMELSMQGYICSQILIIMALEADGKSDPELVRAMGGLNGGIGGSGKICGCLTGGACLLSYYAGKGSDEETPNPELSQMINELIDWFEYTTAEYGGTDCSLILENNPMNRLGRCPELIGGVFEKCIEILEMHGII